MLTEFTRRSRTEIDYDGPIFKKKWLDEFSNQKIEYKNTPFSLGYDIYFISNSNHLQDQFRVSTEVLRHHVGLSFRGQGLASSYRKHGVYSIAVIDRNEKMDIVRFIEVLTHEASHVVDYIIENCAIKNVDTEVRSYILDHIVGLCLRKLKIAENNKSVKEIKCQN